MKLAKSTDIIVTRVGKFVYCIPGRRMLHDT